jgi:hypothetical protein
MGNGHQYSSLLMAGTDDPDTRFNGSCQQFLNGW